MPEFNVKLSFGPMLIGVFFNMILYGILIVQTYTYYQTYRNDALWTRVFVGYLFVLETANSAFDMAMMWQPLIEGFGTADAVKKFPTLFATEPIVMVRKNSFRWYLRLTVSPSGSRFHSDSVLLCMAYSENHTVELDPSPHFSVISSLNGIFIIKFFARKPELHESALLWFLTSCVADVLITGTLVRSLSQRKTGFVVTDSVIDKIISREHLLRDIPKKCVHPFIPPSVTVRTGMITAICAIGDVVFFMTLPRTALNFLWDLALSKLYCNCLLSTLNARASLNHQPSGNLSSGQNRNVQVDLGSGNRRQADRFAESARTSSSHRIQAFEMEHIKSSRSFGTTAEAYIVQPPLPTRNLDHEYGITVVEQMVSSGDGSSPISEWK
ncbi:hypothetical protein D9758_014927 [Tetrapyrgos nigripes]|uniref:DUF6534 domain-containing protein n=1 Tax=Tetrapyrgos nigripes TaxID=182062 RepID=A0A8H5CAB8_9AGAR|nr:hypothetical protein D9758_014927 [Tetrapyrgos nigripes]